MPLQAKSNVSPAPDKQAGQVLRVSTKITPKITKYYLKVSRRYRVMQLFLIAALMAYVVFIVGSFGSYITYDNLQYLLRDLDSMTSQGESEFTRIRYDKQGEQDFAFFKNGIAAAGKESVSLFDSTGLQLCRDQLNCNDPVLVPSDKYLLLYDMGGTGYSVYNSITRVVSRKANHKIVDGDMSDSGAFVLVTRSGETKYVAELYNSALSHTMNIYKDNYVMDTAISKDGSRVVICSAIPAVTDLDCEIALYKAGDKEFCHTVTLPRTLPLSVTFTEDGFVVLCDNGLYFYNMEGDETSVFLTSGMTLEYADLSGGHIVLSGSENALGSEHRIIVLAADGTLIANGILKERVMGIASPSETDGDTLAYVLTPDAVLRLLPKGLQSDTDQSSDVFSWESEPIGEADVLALRSANRGVLVFTAADAYYLFN